MNSVDGIITKPARYSVPETLDRLEALLRGKGITVFVRIDHSVEAEKVGMKMPRAQLSIFGNPKGGTAIMITAPLAAIDLPLKALAWQDADGKVWLSYNDPEYLQRRFGLARETIQPIVGMGSLIEQAAG
jgi:uncharacterized protein (DUF302 family)